MAKVKKRVTKAKAKAEILKIDLKPINYIIIGVGIAVKIFGYVFLSQNSVDGFMPTIIAPIFLVLGYCVIIPAGLLYKGNNSEDSDIDKVVVSEGELSAKSNIKVS